MLLSFFVLVFFSLALSVLSLSLYWFRSSVFFSSSSVFVRLCLFSDLFFKRGGGRYTWRQSWCLCVGWPVLSSLCFCFFLRLLSDLPSLGLVFFLSFCSLVFARPPFRLLCVSFTPCVLCVHFVSVPCSCFCSSSGFPLFIPEVLSVFFPFVFVLLMASPRLSWPFSGFMPCVSASIMACIVGARRMLPRSAAVSAELE